MQDITSEEFYTIAGKQRSSNRGRSLSPESVKLMELKVGEGFTAPCRWKHTVSRCSGLNTMHVVARRNGKKVTARCWEKNLFVLRIS